jgi:hypothetical protein
VFGLPASVNADVRISDSCHKHGRERFRTHDMRVKEWHSASESELESRRVHCDHSIQVIEARVLMLLNRSGTGLASRVRPKKRPVLGCSRAITRRVDIERGLYTSVQPVLARARERRGGAIDPVSASRHSGYRAACAERRPATGGARSGIV